MLIYKITEELLPKKLPNNTPLGIDIILNMIIYGCRSAPLLSFLPLILQLLSSIPHFQAINSTCRHTSENTPIHIAFLRTIKTFNLLNIVVQQSTSVVIVIMELLDSMTVTVVVCDKTECNQSL